MIYKAWVGSREIRRGIGIHGLANKETLPLVLNGQDRKPLLVLAEGEFLGRTS